LNARYLAHRGTRCPFCDSDEVEGAEVTTGNGTAMQEMSCLSCQHAWVDRYTLTAITVEPEATVTCSLCHCPTPALSAHLHQGQWIGDECWDERLQASE
jgi:ubiquitin C-terminal hydrolase